MREPEAREGKPGLHDDTCGRAVNFCGLRKAATAETSSEHRVCAKRWLQTFRWIRGERMRRKLDFFFSRFCQYLGSSCWQKPEFPRLGSHLSWQLCQGLRGRVKGSALHRCGVTALLIREC